MITPADWSIIRIQASERNEKMTDNEILALFGSNPGTGTIRTVGKNHVFTDKGWVIFDSEIHDKAKFRGKQGSVKRNSKGHSKRQADGWVRYDSWNPNEVIAYYG
jgi:hypothetical protein